LELKNFHFLKDEGDKKMEKKAKKMSSTGAFN